MGFLSMNVVVSAIVDPWVTTFSFVVALAMKIQGQNPPILLRNQAREKAHRGFSPKENPARPKDVRGKLSSSEEIA